jgi:hypothetical protein
MNNIVSYEPAVSKYDDLTGAMSFASAYFHSGRGVVQAHLKKYTAHNDSSLGWIRRVMG